MQQDFTAIDFETATGYRESICQVGIVRVEAGKIVSELNLLVRPPNNYYWPRFTQIHGIDARKTANSPLFGKVWNEIRPYIEDELVVAHNGFGFDFPVLRNALLQYGLAEPDYRKACTYRIYKSNLGNLCREYNIPLNHHDALSDARACARLYQMYLERG